MKYKCDNVKAAADLSEFQKFWAKVSCRPQKPLSSQNTRVLNKQQVGQLEDFRRLETLGDLKLIISLLSHIKQIVEVFFFI